jgi:hypothetical protein
VVRVTGPVVLAPPLDEISKRARPYPAHLLQDCGSGLVLFAAAFQGHNDAIHFARHQLITTCVDTDGERLAGMRELYPPDWSFTVADAWEYAQHAYAVGASWDAVSVDTFTGADTARSLDSLDLWLSVARKVVTCTITPLEWRDFARAGWLTYTWERSEIASWLVLEKT